MANSDSPTWNVSELEADLEEQLRQRVLDAVARKEPLRLHGGDTKGFYGRCSEGTPLDLSQHTGVVGYEPTELVLTARAGTPLLTLEALLAEHGQMLPFEPPHFADGATLGGAVASGLAGPRRPWGGAPRDLVLGVKLLDGQGQILNFGGQVMKNVAGYDVARLMAGALGTLGILLEVSVKVLPAPTRECTRVLHMGREEAIRYLRRLCARPAPLSGACHLDDHLYVRLSGNAAGVESWADQIGGEDTHHHLWAGLRDHRLAFFATDTPLWRLSLPPATQTLACETTSLLDWAGAQRWVRIDASAEAVREQVAAHGGHAALFRHGDRGGDVFHPLDPVRARLHAGLKRTFDPHGLFNRGRLYAEW